MSAPTFAIAANNLLHSLPEKIQRNGRKLSQNTLRTYAAGVERAANHIGAVPLSDITNETVRDLVTRLRHEDYRPATIVGDLLVVKMVTESLTRNGEPLYPLRINRRFCNVPIVAPQEQNAPCATRHEVETALTIPALRGIVGIGAGCGLRISEILALHAGNDPDCDCFCSESALIHIRKTLKTSSARRTVPVRSDLNAFLKRLLPSAGRLFPLTQRRVYTLLANANLPAMHSFRRFFATTKDEAGMNTGALKRLLGHSKGPDVTARYSRAAENIEFLRGEMERTPLGFSLEGVE